MIKKSLKMFLIFLCQIVLLTGMAFGGEEDTHLRQGIIDLSVGENVEKESSNKEGNKEKIDELYMELMEKNILKKTLPRLDAFGIVNIRSYNEDSLKKEVTREYLAKFMIAMLNMEEEAEAAKDLSLYTDVSADRWSVGYVNLAGSLGIIDEKEEGIFSPEESVTYPEAITALIRSLGYKDRFLPSPWPNNFIKKATELAITNDVIFNSTGKLDYGDIFLLMNNTLKARGLEKVEEGDITTYVEYNDTFLKQKFNIGQYDGVKMLEIKKDVDNEGEVKFKFLNDTHDDKYKAGDTKVFKLLYESDLEKLRALLDEEVTVYVKEDNEVIYIEK